MDCREFIVKGRVQGVGFRYYTKKIADNLGIKGFVRNESNGSVYIKAWGESSQLFLFQERIRRGPRFANVEEVVTNDISLSVEEKNILGFFVKY